MKKNNNKENIDKILNVPPLRFNDEEWAYKALGKIASKFDYGLNAEAIDFDGKHKYIRITDIDENTSKFKCDDITTPSIYDSKYLVENNDILLARTGASTGKAYLYDLNDGELYFAGFLIRININSGINSVFIFNQLKTLRFKKWVKIVSNRSGQPGINAEEYKTYNLAICSKNTQDKIADFFILIDKRIETQMKIIKEIESLKNSIVIKIFGDKSKFLNKWAKTKLSDILKERKQYAQKGSKYAHVTLSKEGVVNKTDRYNRDFLVKDEEKEYKVTKLNDICYNPANLKFGVICLNKYGDAIFSPIYVTYEVNKNYNPLFIGLALTNSTFIGHIRKYEQGTVYERMAVSSEDFLKGTIIVPSLEEQNNIVKTFNKIDNKLEIEKNILDKLKLLKNYLLNNMFV